MRHTPEAGAVCGNSASRSLNLLIQSGNGGGMGMFTGFPSLDHAEKIFCNFYSEPPPDTPRARWHPGQPRMAGRQLNDLDWPRHRWTMKTLSIFHQQIK